MLGVSGLGFKGGLYGDNGKEYGNYYMPLDTLALPHMVTASGLGKKQQKLVLCKASY